MPQSRTTSVWQCRGCLLAIEDGRNSWGCASFRTVLLVRTFTFWADGSSSKKNVHCILAHDGLERRKSKIVKIHSVEQMLALAQQHGRTSHVHLVNEPRSHILANRGHAAADSNVLVPGCLFRLP
jgi:hypothetical protein